MTKLNIYFGHNKDIDYPNYYDVLEQSFNKTEYNFIFPHKLDKNSRNGRGFYDKKNIDIFIAEVSMPATGLGIELGFAYDEKMPIYCFYKKGSNPTSSLRSVTENIIEYDNIDDFVSKVKEVLPK